MFVVNCFIKTVALNRGVYFSVWDPPPGGQNYAQISCWGKKGLKGDEKRGEMYIFPPIDLNFANYKNMANKFSPAVRTTSFPFGPKYESRGGGGKYEFKFNIHLWL